MDKIIGIGNALVDVLVQLPDETLLHEMQLPKGSMQLIDERRQSILTERMRPFQPQQATGGSAGNAMLALAGLGDQPAFVGKTGDDEMGRFFAANCKEVGIEARLLQSDRHTGVAATLITPDGERTFGTCLGAAATMRAEEIQPSLFQGYDLLHIEGYLVQDHHLIETICQVARRAGLRLSIDLASYNVVAADLPFFRHLVEEYVSIVFANEEESAAFTQGLPPEEALCEMARLADIAVVKLGARGAMAMQGCHTAQHNGAATPQSERAFVPALRVPVVDTTAAGDFFAGGFLHALARHAPLEECLQAGAILSSHIIQTVGTRLPATEWATIRREVAEKATRRAER